MTDFSRERLEADLERFEVAGLALTSCMSEEIHQSSLAAADPSELPDDSHGSLLEDSHRLRAALCQAVDDLSQKVVNLSIRDG